MLSAKVVLVNMSETYNECEFLFLGELTGTNEVRFYVS